MALRLWWQSTRSLIEEALERISNPSADEARSQRPLQLTTLEEDDARSLAANLVLQTRLRTRPALNQLDADGNIARVVVQIGTYRSMVEKDRFFAWKEKVEAQAEEQGTSVKRLIWQQLKLADFMDFDEAAELTKSAADDEEEE